MIDKPTIIFDLDGTLADTVRDLIAVLNRATEPQGLPPIAINDVGHVVGHGAKAMIERAFAFHGRPLASGMLNRLFGKFLEDYEANIAANTSLYDGVPQAVDRFTRAGWLLGICTNKSEMLATKLVRELGLANSFEHIAGGDTFAFRKPDARHLTHLIDAMGGQREQTVMVGDSITDVLTAKAAQIPFVGVSFGYSDKPMAELDAQRVISHFDELWDAANELLVRAPADR